MNLKQSRINVIEQKIGRNLLLLQKIEHLLKYIIQYYNIFGPINEISEIVKQKENNLKTQTMGNLSSQYINQINTTSKTNYVDVNFKESPFHLSFTIQHELNLVEFEKKKTLLKEIVEERNYLVHHIVIDYDEDSHKSYINIDKKLDKQKDKILIGLNDLKSTAKLIHEFKIQLKTFIDSGKMEKEMYYLVLHNDSPLLIELSKISITKHRKDGWTSLALAGKCLRENVPDEISQLKEKYNHKTLKSLLDSENIFEIKVEKSKNMVLFRLKSDWKEYFEKYWKNFIE